MDDLSSSLPMAQSGEALFLVGGETHLLPCSLLRPGTGGEARGLTPYLPVTPPAPSPPHIPTSLCSHGAVGC